MRATPEMHAHEALAYEKHAHEMHTQRMHSYAHEICTYERHAYKRCTLMTWHALENRELAVCSLLACVIV